MGDVVGLARHDEQLGRLRAQRHAEGLSIPDRVQRIRGTPKRHGARSLPGDREIGVLQMRQHALDRRTRVADPHERTQTGSDQRGRLVVKESGQALAVEPSPP